MNSERDKLMWDIERLKNEINSISPSLALHAKLENDLKIVEAKLKEKQS